MSGYACVTVFTALTCCAFRREQLLFYGNQSLVLFVLHFMFGNPIGIELLFASSATTVMTSEGWGAVVATAASAVAA